MPYIDIKSLTIVKIDLTRFENGIFRGIHKKRCGNNII